MRLDCIHTLCEELHLSLHLLLYMSADSFITTALHV